MTEALIITPVKDSIETTKLTIDAISKSKGEFEYHIYNDFSIDENKLILQDFESKYNFKLINLEDITNTPSPNYKLVLEMAQNDAIEKSIPLIIVESDVIVKSNTFSELISIMNTNKRAGIIGAITVDESGNYNFPYNFVKTKSTEVVKTSRSLSFCCTLLSPEFLKNYNFSLLSEKKDWYDIFISRQSVKMGLSNYLAQGTEVLHLPHSSRPWKNLKYSNPVLYYLRKYLKKRDRI